MAVIGWIGFGILSWLIFGLMAIRAAARHGHIWGYHFENPLLCRAAILFQAPALILECAVMDWHQPEKDRLSVGAARVMWAKFVEPQADVDSVLAARQKQAE
jgi:hypothetical protein